MFIKTGRSKDWLEFVLEQEDWDTGNVNQFLMELRKHIPYETGRHYDAKSKVYAIHRDYWDFFYDMKKALFPNDEDN